MRLLSVVGMKTSKEQRTTIVSDSGLSPARRIQAFFRLSKSFTLIIVAIVLVLSQVHDIDPIARLSQSITNFFTPITYYISAPFNWVSDTKKHFQSKANLIEQNQRLVAANDKLMRDQANFARIANENNSLRIALNVQTTPVDDITTIRLSHHVYDGYTTTFYSPYPQLGDIQKDDSVITTSGFLVGRVINTDADYLRIMPLTDPSSRVPVKFEKNSQHGVLAGDGSKLLILSHIENPAATDLGDILVTSGVGGIFPEGLPIAKVTNTSGSIRCIPLGKMTDQDFVLTITHNKPE